MPKRFTDTDKWKKPFIKTLKAQYKLLWLYILDDCDHAGMWQVDIEIAEIRIGEKIDMMEAIKYFGDKIMVLDKGDKWFIQDFIDFQYGKLNPQNRAHRSVLTLLDKYINKGLIRGLEGDKDKEQDKDKDKDSDSKKEITCLFDQETFDDIKKYFGFENSKYYNQWKLINIFIGEIQRSGQLADFKEAFKYYKLFKEKSKQMKHSFKSFVEPDETTGEYVWKIENWKDKYESLNGVEKPFTLSGWGKK